jgi:hypothetical protein
LNQKNIPKTLTLPLPLAGSVSKPKLSHSVKFYQNNFHKEKPGKKESSHDMQAREKSKAPVKIFTTKIKIKSKILTGLVLALLFYCGSASAELAYLCFVFLRFWFPGPARGESGYLAKPEVHNASYRQPKNTSQNR